MLNIPGTLPSENRVRDLKALFDDSSLGFLMVNDHGLIDYLNDEAARIIGFDGIDEAHGRPMREVDSVINWGLKEALGSILGGNTFSRNEHRSTNLKGHFAVLNIFCSPYRQEDGSIVGILTAVQDITDFHKRKAELEKAICELSIMWQVSEALSSAADLDNVLKIILTGVTANQGLGFNRAFLFLADESEQVLVGKVAVGPRSPEEAGEIWARLAQQQKTLTELLNDYVERESSLGFTLSSLIEGWKISLETPSIFSQTMDETCGTNVFAEDNLTPESKEILKRLDTENVAVAPIISNGRKLGLIAADNQITRNTINDSDVQLLETFANHTAVAIERSQLHARLVEDAARLEEKNRLLAESQEQMVRIEKMSVIGELTSSITHELRNPLTVIGGFANLMLTAGSNDGNSEYLNIILTEAKRAETVLHQVLDFSRASRSECREIDFNLLIRQTHELFASRLKHSQKPPSLNLSDQKMVVLGNPDQLRHAIYQFMDLTVEEMTDECDTEVSSLPNDRVVRLVFEFRGEDKGRAKVVKTLGQIFGNSTGTQKLLMIVAGETIKYHGGSFGVEGGAENLPRIYIELPQKRGSENA